jgi:ATP-dependent exoDNAse (exonuclease V) beta subunit
MDKYSILIPEGADAVKIMTIHKAKGLEFPVVIFPYATEKHKMGKNNVWVELEEKKFPKLKTALLPLNSQLKETEYWQLFVEENDKSMLDLINLLYVVMTRPVNRLYIISIMPPQKVKEVKSLPAIFSYYLGKRNLWNEIQKVYTFGSKVALSQKILRESDNGYSIKRMISGNWTNTILLSMQAPEIWDVTDPERNRKWGNMLHLILSRIASEEDVEKVLSDFFISGLIDNNQKKELKRIMDELIHQPEINAYFKTGLKVRAEAEVLLPSGKSYRPDRIVFNDTETIIMDYKTGKPDEIHKDQIRSYGHILEKMGYRNVIKYLLYIDQPGKVVKVDG